METPKSKKSFKEAIAAAKAAKLPILLTYDIPGRVIQDNVRKLVAEKKVVYLAIPSGHAEEKLLWKLYQLRYLEACLLASDGTALANHLLDCDEMTKSIGDVEKLKAQWMEAAAHCLDKAAMSPDYMKFFSSVGPEMKELHEWAKRGADFYTARNNTAKEVYDELIDQARKGKLKDKDKDYAAALKDIVAKFPHTEASVLARKRLGDPSIKKPFLGRCPMTPREISYLKYRIEHNGQRYYMCCEGCLAGAKRQPDMFVKLLESKRLELTIKAENGKK